MLKAALEYAVDEDMIVENPMRRMRPPALTGEGRQPISSQDARRNLEASQGTRWHAAFAILMTTGVRVSECLGIEWKNIDFKTGLIKIEQQTGRIYGQVGVHLVPPKTKKSRRAVKVPSLVLEALRVHQAEQERERAEAGDSWRGVGTVVCGPDGALYFHSQLYRQFHYACRDLGIKGVTPHSFGHGVATWVQADGSVSLKDTQALLGHASERMTLQYSHTNEEALDRAQGMMDALFPDERSRAIATLEVEQLPRHREVAFA